MPMASSTLLLNSLNHGCCVHVLSPLHILPRRLFPGGGVVLSFLRLSSYHSMDGLSTNSQYERSKNYVASFIRNGLALLCDVLPCHLVSQRACYHAVRLRAAGFISACLYPSHDLRDQGLGLSLLTVTSVDVDRNRAVLLQFCILRLFQNGSFLRLCNQTRSPEPLLLL